MKQRLFTCAGVIALLWAASAPAQIYKWTDENGKVHYSDKKVDATAQAQNVDLGTMPAVRSVTRLTPQTYTGASPARFLLLHEPNLLESAALLPMNKVASMYFGGDCVSPTALGFGEFVQRYRDHLPRPHDLYRELVDNIRRYSYRTQNYSTRVSERDLNAAPPVHLRVEFVDLKINACAPQLRKGVEAASLNNFSFHAYSKANAWLQLRWTLTDMRDEITLFTTTTEGAADQVDGRDANIYKVFMAAYVQAISHFVASPKLPELLTPAPVAAANVPAPAPASPTESPSLLSGLRDRLMGNSVKKSKVANALSLVSPLRMPIVEHYLSENEWPASFAQLNIDPVQLREPGAIDSVELRLGGVLHVNLAASEFGAGQYLQLIPRETMSGTQMSWDCRTNLEKAYWVGDCVGL